MNDYKIIDSFDKPAKVIPRNGYSESDLLPEKPFSVRIKETFSREGIKKFIGNNIPGKNDSPKELIRKIIMDISFICLIASVIYLIIYYFNYRSQIIDSNNIISIVDKYDTIDEAELSDTWSDIKEQYPDVDYPEGMNIGFAELYAVNSDVAGRITIPGTNINTVFMQTNNNSYYLYKDFYGNSSRYGMVYANASCKLGKSGLSKNTIIYGHNTHDKLMFHQLLNYMSVDGYKKSPIVRLDTLYDTTYWKVFAVILTNVSSDLDNGNVFNCLYAEYGSDSSFMSVVSGIYKRSIIHTGIEVKSSDKILSLYTCYQDIFKGGRLIVFARQVRDGESNDVDTSKAYYNSNVLYPQAYYDAKKIDNPYFTGTTEPESEATTTSETTTAKNNSSESSETTTAKSGKTEKETTTLKNNSEGTTAEATTVKPQETTTNAPATEKPTDPPTEKPSETATEKPSEIPSVTEQPSSESNSSANAAA